MVSYKKIYFRADASAQIGYGHFIRTLAIADMLKSEFDCTFFTVSPTEYQVGEMTKVCNYAALNTDTALSEFLDLLKGDEIVVLDNYFYTDDYFRSILQKGCKLVIVGPMSNRHYDVDMLVYGIPQDDIKFTKAERTKLYYGFDYAFIRREFFKCENHKIRNNGIVVCLGGADPLRLTNKILQRLVNIEYPETINVIAGDKVFIDESLNPFIRQYKNLAASQIVELFDAYRLAILSASTITTEALSRGIPVIAGYYADNQVDFYNTLVDHDYICGLDDIRKNNLDELTTELLDTISRKETYKFDVTSIQQRYIDAFKSLANEF